MDRENDIKKEVVEYAHLMDAKGLVNSLEGNLSILDRESGKLYITPTSTRKCILDEDKIAVLKDGEQIGGILRHSGEYRLHMVALEARPDCNAVAHIHAPYLTAYAYCGKDIELKCSSTFQLLFEKIPCLPYGEPYADGITKGVAEALQDSNLVLLGNHGVVAVGKTLESAVNIIEVAEEILRIYHITKEIGEVNNIPDDEIEALVMHHPGSKRNNFRK